MLTGIIYTSLPLGSLLILVMVIVWFAAGFAEYLNERSKNK